MSQLDPTTVDIDDVIRRIQAVRRGELPDDAVSIEELRAAVQAQRSRFASTGQAATASDTTAAGTPKRKKAPTLVVPNLDLGV